MALAMEAVIIDVMSDDGVKPYNSGRKASPKSISAAKRDALWLSAIAQKQDARALSDLFETYGPKLKGWLMARGAANGHPYGLHGI